MFVVPYFGSVESVFTEVLSVMVYPEGGEGRTGNGSGVAGHPERTLDT